jgi:hypothetical protein
MPGYLQVSREAAEHRESRLLSEDDFIRMSREPGTMVLDARSREKFNELHVQRRDQPAVFRHRHREPQGGDPGQGHAHPDLLQQQLRQREGPFPAKIARASLNLSTYIALYSYGYRNVYELFGK